MLEIILIAVVIIIISILTVFIYYRDKKGSEYRSDKSINVEPQFQKINEQKELPMRKIPNIGKYDAFENIVSLIKNDFEPTSFENDEGCEKQLMSFLSINMPNNIITKGHTTSGESIDIVIDGTYALELIIADDEEKFMYLMNLSLQSKKDFDRTLAIIVDIDKLPPSKIQKFKDEFNKIGIRTITVKAKLDVSQEKSVSDQNVVSDSEKQKE